MPSATALANVVLPEEMDAHARDGMTAGHRRGAGRRSRPGARTCRSASRSRSWTTSWSATTRRVRDRKRAEVYERWLELARDDDFVGVQNYERSPYDGRRAGAAAGGRRRSTRWAPRSSPLSLARRGPLRARGRPACRSWSPSTAWAPPTTRLRAGFIEPSLAGLLDVDRGRRAGARLLPLDAARQLRVDLRLRPPARAARGRPRDVRAHAEAERRRVRRAWSSATAPVTTSPATAPCTSAAVAGTSSAPSGARSRTCRVPNDGMLARRGRRGAGRRPAPTAAAGDAEPDCDEVLHHDVVVADVPDPGTKPASAHSSTACARHRSQPTIHGSSARWRSVSRAAGRGVVGADHQRDRLVARAAATRSPRSAAPRRSRRPAPGRHRPQQQPERLGRLRLGELDVDVGVARAEPGHGARHHGRCRGGVRRQPDPAAAQRGEVGELLLGHVQLDRHRVGAGEQHPARLGELDTAGAAEQQCAAGRSLQRLQVLADRWLGPAQLAGGGADRAGPGNRTEDHQALGVHRSSISSRYAVLYEVGASWLS